MADNPESAGPSEGSQPNPVTSFLATTMMTGGHVPLREPVPSTSQAPVRNTPRSPTVPESSPTNRHQYLAVIESQQEMISRQHETNNSQRQEMETQRKMFDEERALWQAMKAELNSKILRLEAELRRSSCTSPVNGASPADVALSEQSGGLWTPTRSTNGTRRSSLGAVPAWNLRLGHPPTREVSGAFPGGFSIAPGTSSTSGRLASIDENTQNAENEPLRLEDGIVIPQDVDPTLKDAGHTPMARRSMSMSTGVGGADTSGDGGSTPKAGEDRLPLDPQKAEQKLPRQPSERQDSYFGSFAAPADNLADEQQQWTKVETPDDQPLEGPLGLTNSPDNERNKSFLGELDRKLSNMNLRDTAGNSQPPKPSPPSGSSSGRAKQMRNADGTTSDVPESEPPLRIKKSDGSTVEAAETAQPLRIKKSQNFGSALGRGEEVDYGKGFPGRQP